MFPTLEHAYQYRKYQDEHPEVAAKILHAPSPWAAMQVARKHRQKYRADWHDIKVKVMTELTRAKVQQNEDVRACLRATGVKTLIENSPVDDYWGSGPDGDGQNVMGKILMQVRGELFNGGKP